KLSEKKLCEMRNNKIGFVFQFYNLVPNLSVEDNIALPLMIAGKKRSAYANRIEEVLDIIGMKDKRRLTPRELSGGQQQRVAIARALVFDPDIIFLDEPIGNLDSKTGTKIMELFRDINRKYGKTIVQVTHSEEAALYGTKLVRVRDGQIESVAAIDANGNTTAIDTRRVG
ncbi:MAG: ATP-binding cassette domain-containing protein, partial [Lachnospiraceae bacterium]|nr:ATP-binding cassette domain-containing protein [Lachnospiraceae bacterium]